MSMHLTERQFFTLSLSGLVLVLLGLYFGLLKPAFDQRSDLRAEIESKTMELQRSGYFMGEAPLLAQKDARERDLRRRLEEWQELTRLLATFPDQDQLGTQDVGNIDYKFQLYATRGRLRRKASEQNIDVPALLGLPDEIDSDDEARVLMLQLRSVETLVDTAIEYGIADIRSIDPLPPLQHRAGPEAESFMEEYPLRIIFEGDMQRLYRLWEAMFQTNQAMLLRNVAMEKSALEHPDRVRMTATLSALLFVRDPARMRAVEADTTERARPRGF